MLQYKDDVSDAQIMWSMTVMYTEATLRILHFLTKNNDQSLVPQHLHNTLAVTVSGKPLSPNVFAKTLYQANAVF